MFFISLGGNLLAVCFPFDRAPFPPQNADHYKIFNDTITALKFAQ